MTTIDEIEKRLKAATPGKWVSERGFGDGDYDIVVKVDDGSYYPVASDVPRRNRRLIVNAKTDLRFLITRVRELEAENARLRATVAILRVDCFARLDAATKDTGTEWGK